MSRKAVEIHREEIGIWQRLLIHGVMSKLWTSRLIKGFSTTKRLKTAVVREATPNSDEKQEQQAAIRFLFDLGSRDGELGGNSQGQNRGKLDHVYD